VPYGQAVPSAPIALDPSSSYLYYVAPVDSSGAEEIVRMNLSNLAPSVIAEEYLAAALLDLCQDSRRPQLFSLV